MTKQELFKLLDNYITDGMLDSFDYNVEKLLLSVNIPLHKLYFKWADAWYDENVG